MIEFERTTIGWMTNSLKLKLKEQEGDCEDFTFQDPEGDIDLNSWKVLACRTND